MPNAPADDDEDDNPLDRTAPGNLPTDDPLRSIPKITKPELQRKPSLPQLTAAQPEPATSPAAAPAPAPAPLPKGLAASIPAPQPSRPASIESAAAKMAIDSVPAAPKYSMMEQMEAMEREEQAAAPAPREQFFAPPPPEEATVVPGARLHTLDAPTEPGLILPPPAPPPQPRPSASAPRAYVPLTAKVAGPQKSKTVPVVLGLVALAIAAGAIALALQHEEPTGDVGEPEVATADTPAVVAHRVDPPPAPVVPPPLSPGRVKFTGVPPGATVTVDGKPIANPKGETPIPVGTRQVSVEQKGVGKFEAYVEIRSGELEVVVVKLKKGKKR